MYDFVSVGPYKDLYRETAKRVKAGDQEAIVTAACALKMILPKNALLVPVPSHTGYPTYTLQICAVLHRIARLPVCDCLRGTPHEGLCELKNREFLSGATKGSMMPAPESLGIHLTTTPDPQRKVCLIDNVIASGTTAAACLSVLPENSLIAVIAVDEDYPKRVMLRNLRK